MSETVPTAENGAPHCVHDVRLGSITLRTTESANDPAVEITWDLWGCPDPGKYGAEVFAVSEFGTLSSLMVEDGFGIPHPATAFARMVWTGRRPRVTPPGE